MLVPIRLNEGFLTGFFVLGRRRDGSPFIQSDLEMFNVLGGRIAEALENASVFEEFLSWASKALQSERIKAETDPLTKLWNRRKFDGSLTLQINAAEQFGLAILDIDNFKKYNDEHGHPAGDQLLVAVAESLKNMLRDGDDVFRYGGEEFALIFRAISDEQEGRRICEQVRIGMNQAITTKLGENVTASIGLAIFPIHASSIGKLIQLADEALYQAKRSGKDRICIANMQNLDDEQVKPVLESIQSS